MEADLLIVHGDLSSQATPCFGRRETMFERAVAISRSALAALPDSSRRSPDWQMLRRDTPCEAEARQALREVYDGLTEGFDLPHLVAARAALA